MNSIILALFEGFSISLATYLISNKKMRMRELGILGLTVTLTLFILDVFAPTIAAGARQGSGFGLGYQQIAGNPRKYYDESYIKKSHEIEKNESIKAYAPTYMKF